MQTVAIDLAPGEIVYSQTNSMCWMNDAIEMDTNTGGGLLTGLMRSFTGGSFFITEFKSRGDGHVAFAPRFPGTILPVTLGAGQSLICRKETFLCAEKSVTLELAWQKRIGAGFLAELVLFCKKSQGPALSSSICRERLLKRIWRPVSVYWCMPAMSVSWTPQSAMTFKG